MSTNDEADPSAVPSRRLSDVSQLRAIAHPMRVRLLEELAFAGPATATELSERVGESPANVSWHLRQLARFSFVEEAGGGRGRQRPWQLIVQTNRWSEHEPDAELAQAGDAAGEVVLEHEVQALRAWRARSRTESPAWQAAAFLSQGIGWLTVEELATVNEEIYAIASRTMDRIGNPDRRPPGSRPVRLIAWGIPARPPESDDHSEES